MTFDVGVAAGLLFPKAASRDADSHGRRSRWVFSVAYPVAMLVHLLVLIDKSRLAMWLSLWIVAMTVALLSGCVVIFDNRRASKQKAADLHELRRQLGLVK